LNSVHFNQRLTRPGGGPRAQPAAATRASRPTALQRSSDFTSDLSFNKLLDLFLHCGSPAHQARPAPLAPGPSGLDFVEMIRASAAGPNHPAFGGEGVRRGGGKGGACAGVAPSRRARAAGHGGRGARTRGGHAPARCWRGGRTEGAAGAHAPKDGRTGIVLRYDNLPSCDNGHLTKFCPR